MRHRAQWASQQSLNEQLVEKLDMVFSTIAHCNYGLTEWERQFITSVHSQHKAGRMLTLKQYEVLQRIFTMIGV